ncbi:hypothetical protein AB0B31_11130 [Catellatospora citrea]|uniref:hypothetical protein n=1 Tax=Catellatospora citrea TaxID=53366 RepID=UPI0033E6577B
MSTPLRFQLRYVIELVEHATAASAHRPNLAETFYGIACPGAVEWVVSGDSVYLRSGGTPALLTDAANPDSHVVVYADGWQPASGRRPGDTELGEGDVTEHIHLNASGMPLLDLCHYAHRMGAWWLTLNVVSLSEYRVEFARRGRPTRH